MGSLNKYVNSAGLIIGHGTLCRRFQGADMAHGAPPEVGLHSSEDYRLPKWIR